MSAGWLPREGEPITRVIVQGRQYNLTMNGAWYRAFVEFANRIGGIVGRSVQQVDELAAAVARMSVSNAAALQSVVDQGTANSVQAEQIRQALVDNAATLAAIQAAVVANAQALDDTIAVIQAAALPGSGSISATNDGSGVPPVDPGTSIDPVDPWEVPPIDDGGELPVNIVN